MIVGKKSALLNGMLPFLTFTLLGLPALWANTDPDLWSDPPVISSARQFDMDQGLVTNCLNEGFVDHLGRIWLNPCSGSASALGLSFFQYDGTQSIYYDLRPDWLSRESTAPIWYMLGETTQGFLFGANRENTILFYWHPDTREQYFFPLPGGVELLSMHADPEGGILVLTSDPSRQTYRVHRLVQGTSAEVAIIAHMAVTP